MVVPKERIDVDKPPWDQSTFVGRMKYFAWMTDMRTVPTSTAKLESAKELLEKYRLRQEPAGTTEKEIRYAMKLYKSAYHPDTGELQNVFGRMSFYVPGGMVVMAGMVQFYRTNTAVIFWQWANQSLNVLINYTNRNAASGISTKQMAVAYVSATTSAIVTAVSLKTLLARRATAGSLMQRFVPFVACAAAHMVNIPLTRQSELINGIACFDEKDNRITNSRYAAIKGVSQVATSRIFMAAPPMLLVPVIMENLAKRLWFRRLSYLHSPLQILLIGVFTALVLPIGCAFFPQRSSISTDRLKKLDSAKLEELKATYGDNIPHTLYFNKGL